MNYPKVTLVYDHERLTDYLCYVAKQIACGYYQDRRFLILPRLIEKDARTIFFPDLPYLKTFWEQLKKFSAHEYVFHFDKKLTQLAKELLASQEDLLRSKKSSFPQEEIFFDTLAEFIPAYDLSKVKNIRVLVTPFGTVGSLFFVKNDKNYDFEVTVREDFGPAQIAETILTCFFHIEQTNMSIPAWTNREAIIDFLLSKTKFAKIFNYDYVPTVSSLPELSRNLVLESEKYLEKLGFPLKPLVTDIHLTPTEKRIWSGLIANKGQLVTYDQIGNLFWGEEGSLEKYSLYSIAKIMEKIRKKIKDQGIYQELIYTIRGQGYVVYD